MKRKNILQITQASYETTDFHKTNLITIPYDQIDYLCKTPAQDAIGPVIFAAGLTGGILAPLACIDKNSESGFNSKRYVTILKYAAVTAGLGIITFFALST